MRFEESPPHCRIVECTSLGSWLIYEALIRPALYVFAIANNVAESMRREAELKSLDECIYSTTNKRRIDILGLQR